MKRKLTITLAALLMMAMAVTARAADADELKAASEAAVSKLKEKAPGAASYFDTSAGYAVFPSVGKGGLIIGGEHGKGLVYEKGKAVGEATLTEASIGAQVGGETFSEFIFFETPEKLQEFKQGKYTMNAAVHAMVSDKGAEKSANFQDGIAVVVVPKSGVMAEASVGGQKFKYKPMTTD